MKKILTVVGARPQFIKAAPLSQAITRSSYLYECMVHTGQHYDDEMSQIFFDELRLPYPNHRLGVGGGTHAQNTGRTMELLEGVVSREDPSAVLVFGDTDSTLAGSLVAAKAGIPLMHVEAGLRSYNRSMPEEINRIVADHLSSLLFAPTLNSVENLMSEGIGKNHIKCIGDIMYDAVKLFESVLNKRTAKDDVLEKHGLKKNNYILVTVHRKENTDNIKNLLSIFRGIEMGGEKAILPMHPRLKKIVDKHGIEIPSNITVVSPLGYLDMMYLQKFASLIATDSGGVQKEAYFHKIPCVTLRNETEWTELVDEGCNVLVGSNAERIAAAIRSPIHFQKTKELYGDGHAAAKIVKAMEEYLYG